MRRKAELRALARGMNGLLLFPAPKCGVRRIADRIRLKFRASGYHESLMAPMLLDCRQPAAGREW